MKQNRSVEVFAAVCTGAAVAASASLAADILVPQDAPTIQAGIDLAQSGDRVLVGPGTYVEQIDLGGRNITIESTDGADVTTIDGGGTAGFVVTVNSGETDAALIGFTVTGGFGEAGSLGAGPGGGMRVEGASVTIENTLFTGNVGIEGGGLSISDGSAIIRHSRFENNQAIHGGGMYIELGTLTLESSSFDGNSAPNFGGALAIFWLTDATVTDTTFVGNAAGFGGAIYTNHADIDFHRLSIIDNGKAEEGEHGGWTISTLGGGGIYTTSTNGRINASRIRNNIAAAGSGLYIAGSGTVEVVNALIAENGTVCNCGQGAVYANSASPVIINSTIVGNGGFFGIFTTYNSFPTVRNTIIAGQQNALDSQSPTAGNGLTDVAFSLLQGDPFAATTGDGNIVVEDFPLLDGDADFAPLAGSAVIGAGTNSAVPADITTDLLGNNRIVGGTVDIGAIEFGSASDPKSGIPGDVNGDGIVDMYDLMMLLSAWGPCHGDCPEDLAGNKRVGITDALILLEHMR
jgi:predicted outer membrane repeat protein